MFPRLHRLDHDSQAAQVPHGTLGLALRVSPLKTTTTARRLSWGTPENFNGEDIIDIILAQPATARFIARHLYGFFVADEVQVPAWQDTPPRDPAAVEVIAEALAESDFDMRHTLRVLFNSDFFKEARLTKVKNPTEVVVGTLRMVGGAELPSLEVYDYCDQITYMGQSCSTLRASRGGHYGSEWINSSSLMKRANFVAGMVAQVDRPGVSDIIERVKGSGESPESAVDACLEMLGSVVVKDETRAELIEHASARAHLNGNEARESESARRVAEILQLIVATREYQFA